MANTVHLIAHEKGDVILVLKKSDKPFAVWDEAQEHASVINTAGPESSLLNTEEGKPSILDEPQVIDSWGSSSRRKGKKGKKEKKTFSAALWGEPEPEPATVAQSWAEPDPEPAAVNQSWTEPDPEPATATKSWSERELAPSPAAELEPEPTPATESWPEPEPQSAVAEPNQDISNTESIPVDEKALSETQVQPASPVNASPAKEPEIRMQVSSSHLIEASHFFALMLTQRWQEGKELESIGYLEVPVNDNIDPDALLIVMNVIHGRTRQVPRSVDLETLAKLAVVVDFYECQEAVEFFSETWVKDLEGTIPKSYGRKLMLWLFISRVFYRPHHIEKLAFIASKQSKGPIQTMGLPIPEPLVETIEARRQDSVQQIMKTLHDVTLSLLEGTNKCSFECDSILLGALIKKTRALGLFSPRPTKPFYGLSHQNLVSSICEIQSPRWWSETDNKSSRYDGWERRRVSHACTFKDQLELSFREIEDSMENVKFLNNGSWIVESQGCT